MQRRAAGRVVAGALALVASLSGCAPAPQATALGLADRVQAAVREPSLSDNAGEFYVTQFKATAVNAYTARGSHDRAPFCTIPGIKEVNSIGVDATGTLWIPQQNNNNGTQSILSFGPHCGAAGITLLDSDGFPTAIAFDSKGTNYVENTETYPSGSGNVLVFPKGNTSPAAVLTNAAFHLLTAVGVDAQDNVFVLTIASGNRGALVEFKGGHMPGRVVRNDVTAGIPGGALLFDRLGHLIVDDYANATLSVFAPPFHGKPQKIRLQGVSWQCSFNPSETKLACADSQNGSVDVYTYPSLAYVYSITSGLAKVATVVGIAYDPAAAN
jgi:hypothetical protein